jgi:PIN domain nuclease of toxin-antitoxin system
MTFLIDSQAFLWMGSSPDRLSPRSIEAIMNESTRRLVSYATLWELAIKVSLGKLVLREASFETLISEGLAALQAELLAIEPKHIQQVASLPFHHRDPFDRMLIAQAQVEGIPIISSDLAFDAYGLRRIW